MTTKLIPPNITPNWRPSQDRVGLLKVEHEEGDRKYFSLQNWYVQDDDQHAANCKFFGSTTAMAEALVLALDYLTPALPHLPLHEPALTIRAALLSAGYRFAPVDAE
jgi:hypothetical protein